jgi:hypothetical protein
MNTQSRLEQLFRNLDQWRHLPNYQLERRADAFFSLYLPGLVQEKVGRPIEPIVVPELPILCSLIWSERQGMKSVKADYLLLAEDRSEAYFVELKTDSESRRDAQDEYLKKACGRFQAVIEGVIGIAKASSSSAKYASLLQLLASMRLVQVPASGPISREWFGSVKALPCPNVVKTIYLQPGPAKGDESVIDFKFVRSYLARYDDEFSTLFAKYLERWEQRAGTPLSDESA